MNKILLGLVGLLSLGQPNCLMAGHIWAWGGDGAFTNVPGGLGNIVAVAAGDSHALALTSEGTVVAWGDNSSNQTNVPSGLSNVVAIAAGGAHSLALKADGTVTAWGA